MSSGEKKTEEEEERVERESLQDLKKILSKSRKSQIGLLLIGGYAVAAYTRGYRYTKDIDLVADKQSFGKFRGLLNDLGYSTRKTDFGIAGTKRIGIGDNNSFVDLHISVGKVHDISTNNYFPIDPSLFKKAKGREVRGFYSKSTVIRAPVVDLETILILKLIPVGRDKDEVDLISLVTDRSKDVDLELMGKIAKEANLGLHILDRTRYYATRIRRGELERIWTGMTGARLSFVQKRELLRFLASLADQLR